MPDEDSHPALFQLRNPTLAVIVVACLLLCPAAAFAQQAEAALMVLILNSYDESTTPYTQGNRAFSLEFARQSAPPVAFRHFDLNQRSASESTDDQATVELLRSQYSANPPGLVAAIGPPAVAFWLRHRESLFPDVPFVAAAAETGLDRSRFRPGDAAVSARFSFNETLDGILRLLPDTRHVLMVFGNSQHERELGRVAATQLGEAFPGLSLDYTNDLTTRELQDRLAELQTGSVVLYGIFESDVSGVLMHNYAGLSLVREASPVPVFGAFDVQLGQGIVGGRLMQIEEVGRAMAAAAAELLRQRPTEVIWKEVDFSLPLYDARELEAWRIARDRLPAGSVVLFEPPSLWEQHARWIVLTGLMFALLLTLVVSLLLQMRRRRNAERITADLGNRLINAHEDERRLIARELHDDLSQRLARLAIDASFLTSRPDSDVAKEVLQGLQPELVRISKDVHDLSYRLHPALLDDLGLAEALRAECERVRRRSNAEMIVRIEDVDRDYPRSTLLCIYRIGQEALQNAVRHGKPDRIEVTLAPANGALSLTVRDNGTGFDVERTPPGKGLGLSSMRERARLAGGRLEITSRRGEGTTVRVTVSTKGRLA